MSHTEAPVNWPAAAPPLAGATQDLRSAVEQLQRERVTQALLQHHGNVAAAGRSLGLDRANLVRLAQRLGIAIASQRRPPDDTA